MCPLLRFTMPGEKCLVRTATAVTLVLIMVMLSCTQANISFEVAGNGNLPGSHTLHGTDLYIVFMDRRRTKCQA